VKIALNEKQICYLSNLTIKVYSLKKINMCLKIFLEKSNQALLLFLIYILTISCDMPKNEQHESSNDNFEKPIRLSIPDTLNAGILYQKVAINHDELNTFALYLPKLYNKSTLWPVVFFFDAGGNGALPVAQYQQLADSLGYVFVGSNVSKNGQSPEEAIMTWESLKNCCLNNFSINKNRILLAGFSGGARVCCTIAFKESDISGLIANSAGAQELEQLSNNNTLFIGLAGSGDMNRAEMIGIDQHLLGSSLKHFYIEFDGKHEWAPIKTMQKALMLASMNDYLNNPNDLNPKLIENFIAHQKSEIEKLKSKNKWVEAYNELLLLTDGTKGMNTKPFESIDSLKNNSNFISQKNDLLKLTVKETEIQQELYKLMLENPDINVWHSRIAQIRKNALQKNDIGQMHQRLLGYASLLCYSLSNRNLVAKNYPAAELMVSCYEIADPENAEVYFFKAILNAAQLDSANTYINLNKSIKLGFTDKKRISNQLEFNFLREDVPFNQILN